MSLAESAANRIAREIASGVLQPGQRLPPERDLAITYGVSRGALREGFSPLESRIENLSSPAPKYCKG